MKTIILALAVCFSIGANAQVSNQNYPFGKADFQTPTVTSKATAQTITVINALTYADLGTIDTNKVLTVAVGSNSYGSTIKLPKGSQLFVKYVADATARTIASTTGCSCGTYTSTASKVNVLSYIYDGTTFYCTGSIKAQQ